jgi:putative NIF3 family GTP cyclohydrolase 1 type 2
MIHPEHKFDNETVNSRRKFIASVGMIAGAEIVLSIPFVSKAANFITPTETFTVADIMNRFIKDVPGGALKETVDTLKSGSADMKVKGIVTTMFATVDVIKKAIALDANFIIAHEPTFYNHEDDVAWLKGDAVYEYKSDLLKQNNITVWRNHDYIHRLVPDGVTMGVLEQLGWKKYSEKALPNLINIPAVSLKELISYLKTKLGIEQVRFIGDVNQICKRILFEPGAAGRNMQIGGIRQYKPDVLICGEISEWETAEYVRDARAKGDAVALIVLGHIASEQAGSEFMLEWLKQKFPSIQSTYIPVGNSLSFL